MNDDVEYNLENFTDSEEDLELNITDIDDENWMTALPSEHREKLRKEYKKWYKSKKDSNITQQEVLDSIMTDLTFLYKMSTEEYTLYRKWDEIKRKYPAPDADVEDHNWWSLDGMSNNEKARLLKNNIWIPNHIDDYIKLEPKLVLCNDNSTLNAQWNMLRTFIHTQLNNSNIGRNLYFIVQDKPTGKYIGLINISSDFMDLTPRDNYIGWSREIKTGKRMINHTAIASTICPTQPLGYNYLGGKLIALLSISSPVIEAWNKKYNNDSMPSKLVGMTTTSLYSSFSQYQNLAYWNKRGHSAGSIKFEISKETLSKVKDFLQREYPLKFWEWYIGTEPQGMPLKRDFKQRSLSFVYNLLKIEKKYFETNHERGIYFCPFYDNMKEYLKMEITEDKLKSREGFKEIKSKDINGEEKVEHQNSPENLTILWKDKYAKKRIDNFKRDNREFSFETLFYDDLITLTWEETKEKYLKQVGR